MKRVFHIISRFDVGGAEAVAINIAKTANDQYEHHIVELQRGHSRYSKTIISDLKQKGIAYHRSPFPIYFHLHYYVDRLISVLFPLRFLLLWLRYRPEVVHTHTEMPDMALWLSLRMFPFIKVEVVRTIHNTVLWSGMEIVGPRVERFMQSRGANVAISPNVQRTYCERYGQLPSVIYNGVTPVAQQTYEGLVRGKINICFAGRFELQKGISVLCEIVKRLGDDSRFHFHIFGSGSMQGEIDGIRLLPDVTVNPPLHGLPAYLASFDYLIMPSLHEGLSILALEASINGLPLIANSCDGLSDTLPADWPLTVTDNSLEQWMRLFDRLPSVDRQTLAEQAYEYVDAHFSLERMQEEYHNIYNRKTNR